MALAAIAAVVSLSRPWSGYVAPGTTIQTTRLAPVPDLVYGGTTLEVVPGIPIYFPGDVKVTPGTEGSIRVIGPIVALAFVWALRRGRWAVARILLLAAAGAPGLAGGWSYGGPTVWLVAVVIAAVGSGLLRVPRSLVAPAQPSEPRDT
jgi:hypothetical protein